MFTHYFVLYRAREELRETLNSLHAETLAGRMPKKEIFMRSQENFHFIPRAVYPN